jgi:isopentenyl phosphate kinase
MTTGGGSLIFVKLGGSLITDKRQEATPRIDVLRRLAQELAEARQVNPALRVVFGHGSGSFGHWEASRYDTRKGVHSAEDWYGFARVSAAALQLNRLVVSNFVDAGVPMMSLQPSASVVARDGTVISLDEGTIGRALDRGLVPLIFGDVAFDEALGGTILSTEDLFIHLAETMHPSWILLLGNAPGVLDNARATIPTITPESYPKILEHLRSSRYTDVTGGMADKVERMVSLVQQEPQLRVRIMTGAVPGSLRDALLDPAGFTPGTLICASDAAVEPDAG